MSRRRKYRPGRKITTMSAMARELDAMRYTFFHSKPMHPGWVRSMTYQTISYFVNGGNVRKAMEIK